MEKDFQVFNEQKTVNFVPQQILIFLFSLAMFQSVKIIDSKFRLVSKSTYFSRDSLCFIYFDLFICQRLRKKFKPVELFFQLHE